MIKASTYIFGLMVMIFVFLVREKKINEIKLYSLKEESEKNIQLQNQQIKELVEINKNQEIKALNSSRAFDSLKTINKTQGYKIATAKKKLTDEKTRVILNAPDSTILRILSEHDIKTKSN